MTDLRAGAAVDEDGRPCAWCGERAAVECAGCDVATCARPEHLDGMGFLLRAGEDGPFHLFFCEASGLPLCAMCLDRPRDVEALRPLCPMCGGPVTRVRVDGVGLDGAAAALVRHAERFRAGPPPETLAYDGEHGVLDLPLRRLVYAFFPTRPRRPRPGEAWETAVRIEPDGGPPVTLVLRHRHCPYAETTLSLEGGGGDVSLDAPARRAGVWRSESLAPLLGPAYARPRLTLALDPDGVSLARLDEATRVTVEQRGIRPRSAAAPARSELLEPQANVDGEAAAERWARAAGTLGEITRESMWDWRKAYAPEPGAYGADAVMQLDGSRSTIAPQMHVHFTGVRYETCPRAFSWAVFEPASPAEEAQLRDLAPFGPVSVAARIHGDASHPFTKTTYVVFDDVEWFVPPPPFRPPAE